MEFLKNQIERIQQQLGALSASQKMLTATLLAIMVMTIYFWARYAGQAEMVPVLNQPMSADEIGRISTVLKGQGIDFKVVGDRIQVPVDSQVWAWSILSERQLLPADTKSAFDELVLSKSNPFFTQYMTAAMMNEAKQVTLSRIIARWETWGVRDAMVIIDPTSQRGIGESIQPKATVNITTRAQEGKPNQTLVNAAASLVSGAVANLAKERVSVIVNGVNCRVNGANSTGYAASDYLTSMQEAQKYWADQLREHLSVIPGVMVAVTVQQNNSSKTEHSENVDPKTLKSVPVKEQTTNEETNSTSPPAGDTGTLPNVGMNLGAAGGGSNINTRETTSVESVVIPSKTVTDTVTPGGDHVVATASVLIPKSYFVDQLRKPGDKEPDDGLVRDLITTKLPEYREITKKCVGLKDDEAVNVAVYPDVTPLVAAGPSASAAGAITFPMGDHLKEIGVGALALLSLFMVSMMVKKGSPPPVAVPVPAPKVATLASGEEAVGEASEGNALLDGMELDEDSVKAQQMLDQVSTMVKDNPDAAANLVKRWLNR